MVFTMKFSFLFIYIYIQYGLYCQQQQKEQSGNNIGPIIYIFLIRTMNV